MPKFEKFTPRQVAEFDPWGLRKKKIAQEGEELLKEGKGLPRRSAEGAKAGEFAVIKALNPEGKEIVFDFEEIREHWQDFYKKHDIKADIPDIKLTQEDRKEVEKLVEKFGFDKAIIIPENLPNYDELHRKMTQGYNQTWQGDNFKEDGSFGEVEDLKQGFRIIFTKDTQNTIEDDFFKQTVNLPPEDPTADNDLKRFIENIKNEKDIELEGLAFSTYLIYQKEYFERTGKHLDADGWTWLIGSKMRRSGRIPFSYWNPALDELYVVASSPARRDSYGGCRLSRSLKI